MLSEFFTPELVFFMREVTGGTEDFSTVSYFFETLKYRATVKEVLRLVDDWDTYTDIGKTQIAINYAGIYHSSRFILLIDYLRGKRDAHEI